MTLVLRQAMLTFSGSVRAAHARSGRFAAWVFVLLNSRFMGDIFRTSIDVSDVPGVLKEIVLQPLRSEISGSWPLKGY